MGCTTSDDNYDNNNYPSENREESREDEEEETFKDFAEIGSKKKHYFINIYFIDGKTIGEGIKKIPAYVCTVPYDKLNELKEKFWNSKKKYRRIWRALRECCESDEGTAVMLLEAAEMACLNGDLRQVISLENPDYVFKIPNYCICDPVFERDYNEIKEKNKDIEEKKIKIILYYLAENKNINIHATNKTLVKKVKEEFAKKYGIDLKTHKVRLLFRGQELLDENLLCYNNVEDMSKIQVMVNQK